MINTNLFGLFGIVAYMLLHGDFEDLFQVARFEGDLYLWLQLAGIGGTLAVAVLCYTTLIKKAGPVVAVGVATVRKVASIVFTYLIFPKPLVAQEIAALFVIALGMAIEGCKSRRGCTDNLTKRVEKLDSK